MHQDRTEPPASLILETLQRRWTRADFPTVTCAKCGSQVPPDEIEHGLNTNHPVCDRCAAAHRQAD